MYMHEDVKEILLTEANIRKRVKELGEIISRDYQNKNLLLVSILKGSIIFLSDLLRAITIPVKFDLMTVSSYKGERTSGGKVHLVMDLKQEVTNQHVLIVEDIYDTGNTLKFVIDHVLSKNPASLKICVLMKKEKKEPEENPIHLDYIGFVIPDKFVVGYGLDYQEKYRNLPYVCVLKDEIYQRKENLKI